MPPHSLRDWIPPVALTKDRQTRGEGGTRPGCRGASEARQALRTGAEPYLKGTEDPVVFPVYIKYLLQLPSALRVRGRAL